MLYKHPGGGRPAPWSRGRTPKWGETPLAFVELKPGERGHGGGADRPLPQPPRRLQVPARDPLRAGAADQHRQDPEAPAARQGRLGRRASDRRGRLAAVCPGSRRPVARDCRGRVRQAIAWTAPRIRSVHCLQLRLPFDHGAPAPLFAGNPRTTLDSGLMRVELAGGVVGWGESYGADLDALCAIVRNRVGAAGGRARCPR